MRVGEGVVEVTGIYINYDEFDVYLSLISFQGRDHSLILRV